MKWVSQFDCMARVSDKKALKTYCTYAHNNCEVFVIGQYWRSSYIGGALSTYMGFL